MSLITTQDGFPGVAVAVHGVACVPLTPAIPDGHHHLPVSGNAKDDFAGAHAGPGLDCSPCWRPPASFLIGGEAPTSGRSSSNGTASAALMYATTSDRRGDHSKRAGSHRGLSRAKRPGTGARGRQAILDGEIVAFRSEGLRISACSSRASTWWTIDGQRSCRGRSPFAYFVVLFLDGQPTVDETYRSRRACWRALRSRAPTGPRRRPTRDRVQSSSTWPRTLVSKGSSPRSRPASIARAA